MPQTDQFGGILLDEEKPQTDQFGGIVLDHESPTKAAAPSPKLAVSPADTYAALKGRDSLIDLKKDFSIPQPTGESYWKETPPQETAFQELKGVGEEPLSTLGNVSRAIPADLAALMSVLKKPANVPSTLLPSPANIKRAIGENLPFSKSVAGNIPAAISGEALPIDTAISDAAQEAKASGEFPAEATLAKISQGIAATAPMAVIGGLPAAAQKAILAGFTTKMISDAPGIAKELGDELGKPQEQRDPDKVSSLVSDAAQILGFSVAGGVGLYHGLKPGPKAPTKFPVTMREIQKGVPDASQVSEAAKVYGNVRAQQEPAGALPIKESIPGVQPQAGGGVPEASKSEVPLKEAGQKVADDLGMRFNGQHEGYWTYTLFDESGKGSTDIAIKAGSTKQQVLDKYNAKIEEYKKSDLGFPVPRPPKTAVEPPKTISGDDLLKMSPEEFVKWKKANDWSEAKGKEIAKTLSPDEINSLESHRSDLAKQRSKLNKESEVLKDAGDESWMDKLNQEQNIWAKEQSISEILKAAPIETEAKTADEILKRESGTTSPEEISNLPESEYAKLFGGGKNFSLTSDATRWAMKNPKASIPKLERLRDEHANKLKDSNYTGLMRSQWFADAIHALKRDDVGRMNIGWEQKYQEKQAAKRARAVPAEPALAPGPGAQTVGETPKPELVGMGGMKAGEIPNEPSKISTAKSFVGNQLNKARNTIVHIAKSGNVRDTLSYTRDAGDNAANNFAKEQANEPRNAIRRLFPKEADQRISEDALSFVVESKGNPDALTEMRQKVMDSKLASPKWKKKAFDAIDFAIYNYDKLKPVADRYSKITDQQVIDENAAGIDTLKRDGYVMHAQEISDIQSGFLSEGGGGQASAFKKVRTHDTFADSIAAGVDPKSLNSINLLESRLAHGQKMINSREWVEGLSDLTDPTTGKSIATKPMTVTRADGSTYQQAPEGYTLERAGFQPVSIHKGYEGIFGALTDPSWFQKNAATRNFLKANAVGKSINLMIDTFHLGRMAFWESLIKGLGVETFEAPIPSYRKGLTLIDNTVPEIREMARRGEIPASWMPEMLENKRRLDLAVKTGYNIGKITDNLHSEWIRNVPIAGHVNKFIFDKFQRGAMSEVWLLEFKRIKKALPDLNEIEAARRVSKDLNVRFGSLGRQGIFKSRTAQDASKLFILAPQWNEGLIRSELGAVKQAGQLAIDAAKGRQIYSGVLLRSVGAMALAQFAANQLINLYTRGTPTWDNPEEGIGAKLSAWIPDKIGNGPGFFLHPLGLAAETTHLIMQKYEKTEDFRKTLSQYLRTRSSAAMRPVLTFITNQDALGRNLKPGSVWGEIVKSAIPTPIGGSAITQAAKQVITGEPSESFPGQYQKQALASGGIKTDQAPSPRQRIQALASEFKRSKGITPSGEFYTGDYQPLSQASEIGNQAGAKDAVADLLKKKTAKEIVKHYRSSWKYPFTGSKTRESEFFRTLNPEQQETYRKALEERKQSSTKSIQAVRDFFSSSTSK